MNKEARSMNQESGHKYKKLFSFSHASCFLIHDSIPQTHAEARSMSHESRLLVKLFFLVSLASCFLLLPSIPQARAEGLDLGLYPPVIRIDTTPPASVKTPLTIENQGDQDVTAEIQYKIFRPSKFEDGTIEYLTGKNAVPSPDPLFFQHVQVLENDHVISSVQLAPKQQKNLELHIGIDKTAVPADYYFSVIFLAKPSDSAETGDAGIANQNAAVTTGGIASNVLLSIGPKGKSAGKVAEFSAPHFLSSGPVPLTLRIENRSNHSIAPEGTVFIKNIFGQYVGKVDLLPVSILAHSTRAIPDKKSIEENSASAVYTLAHTSSKPVLLWPEPFLFGPYTVGVYIKLSNEGPVLTQTTYFFAFPWQGIILLIILLLLGIIIREKVKKRIGK